jgi:hypothetical protein
MCIRQISTIILLAIVLVSQTGQTSAFPSLFPSPIVGGGGGGGELKLDRRSENVHALEKRAQHNVTSANKAGLGWNNPQSTNMTPFLRSGKVGW